MYLKFLLILRLLGFTFSLITQRLSLVLSAKLHRLTYRVVSHPKNIVIVGGSFGGYFLATRLAESLPSGYKVILIEKHTHFYFTWNFPRSTVVPGQEDKAFIPYPDKPADTPEGSFELKRGVVTTINEKSVVLATGEVVEYAYLALATGSQHRYPAALHADDKAGAVRFFADVQNRIQHAETIVVVGGGAAGVEVAGDIRSKYPLKTVTLVHSRDRLLNSFAPGLHAIAKPALEELGVKLHLGERVVRGFDLELDLDGPGNVVLSSGTVLPCDLLIKCTGQTPDSQLVRSFAPSSVAASGAILVHPTLQVKIENAPSPNVYALGDVVDLPGPKMGRAASMQGFLVAENIVRSIRGKKLRAYVPSLIDSSIELTLGLTKNVTYISDGTTDVSFSKKMTDEAMHAAQAWRLMGAKPFEEPNIQIPDRVVDKDGA
ncbi:Apoptosis-inducing factor 2 [Cladophialophora carrionii]|uniref:Apoptosis-inducing factor 2 n=1 Tax=Cladophialophora carrionii TaxID=86049 RepID=A0A1C1CIB8_9EURO|nr:Apoptosis-inducing factor 2 [Cladophialophora carrionii]